MSQHILYCNDNADVFVLDLPTSIARAQASNQNLCSTSAVQIPYTTPEPKGKKRDSILSATSPVELEYYGAIENIVLTALTRVHKQWPELSWCLPRLHEYIEQTQLRVDIHSCDHGSKYVCQDACAPVVLSSLVNNVCCLSAFANTVVHNPCASQTELKASATELFIIPARSTFLCASIEQGQTAFESAVRCLLPTKHFDLVLLDPPWSNRSVRRGQAYRSVDSQLSESFDQVLPVVTAYLSHSGYLAIWTTNKIAVRSHVLEACARHGLLLEQEWIWLKITTKGEPIFPLDGLWRKPYEMLLLFGRAQKQQNITRKVVITVPDVHSRKPSLKSIFERILPKRYNALEIFARSLTAGWWSWGDEVLKFQHESNWY